MCLLRSGESIEIFASPSCECESLSDFESGSGVASIMCPEIQKEKKILVKKKLCLMGHGAGSVIMNNYK